MPSNLGVGNAGVANDAGFPSNAGFANTAATAAAAGSNNAVGANAGGFATSAGTFSQFGGTPFVGSPIAGPASPYTSNVPSIPTPTPVMNAVLPPAMAKAPLSQEEVGAMRAWGERDLDNAAVVLAMYANEVDAAWFRYKNGCLGGFTSETTPGREWFLVLDGRVRLPNDDQCRMLYSSLLGMATGWEQQLEIALDAARRADVLPGRIRETLDRHRIDR
jgi:hypothetical protein